MNIDQLTTRFLNRYYNCAWIRARLLIAYRAGRAATRGVETCRIRTAQSLIHALMPVYLQMNLTWNGCCSPETDLRHVPWRIRLYWEQLPLSFWNEYSNIAADCGMVHLENHADRNRRIPQFIKESVVFDLREGVGGLGSLPEDIVEEERLCLSCAWHIEQELAHSYRHLNSAINFALTVTQKEYCEENRDKKSMKLFNECSRWPEAIVRELGPDWIVECSVAGRQ